MKTVRSGAIVQQVEVVLRSITGNSEDGGIKVSIKRIRSLPGEDSFPFDGASNKNKPLTEEIRKEASEKANKPECLRPPIDGPQHLLVDTRTNWRKWLRSIISRSNHPSQPQICQSVSLSFSVIFETGNPY
jgi:hypothetical protein